MLLSATVSFLILPLGVFKVITFDILHVVTLSIKLFPDKNKLQHEWMLIVNGIFMVNYITKEKVTMLLAGPVTIEVSLAQKLTCLLRNQKP